MDINRDIEFSRCVKHLGGKTPEELSSLFSTSRCSEVEKEACVTLLKLVIEDGRRLDVPTLPMTSPKKKGLTRPMKKSEVVCKLLQTMTENLSKYEQTCDMDYWEINFLVGGDYSMSLMEIKFQHEKKVDLPV